MQGREYMLLKDLIQKKYKSSLRVLHYIQYALVRLFGSALGETSRLSTLICQNGLEVRSDVWELSREVMVRTAETKRPPSLN